MRGWRTSSMSCIDETFERLAESEEASKHATQRTKQVERNGVELKEAIDKFCQEAELEHFYTASTET